MPPEERPPERLEAWIERQHAHAAASLLRSVSPVELTKTRPGFGQTIRAKRGAIVASPVLAAYDPDPDYFFHWYRDSAIVVDALRLLFEQPSASAADRAHLLEHFADFIRFSLDLRELDGRALSDSPAWRARVRPDFAPFVRSDTELAAVHGEAVAAETRVNPDGTIDISKWGRPQNDGPALRALAVLRWMPHAAHDSALRAAAASLLSADLAFTRQHARAPCIDIWEEEHGLHYYTLCVSAAALEAGARWLEERGARNDAPAYRQEASAIYHTLDAYWLAAEGYYRSRVLSSGARSAKELDIAVIFAALHAAGRPQNHSARDPRVHATLARLAALFDAEYAINRNRPASRAPALGRYAGDVYYSGGAYYFSTLAGAELSYRAAVGTDGREALALLARGDAFLETVRAFTPPNGDLSEQFDQHTGAQTSAKHLAWSYAAFISAIAARRDALTASA
ncbi:MAG TPA: glycoside hydrolase family 15 protein [Steroidobacteraceae bacterium]|nr:glycoside hydrolase family 15 protein [Steroidobacteraceae bacterium]